MSPKKFSTRRVEHGEAVARRRVGEKYLEVADVVAVDDGTAINVCVGLCVLAGIAAGDAICGLATGEHYSGRDHAAAAELLARVDATSGKRLRALVALKPASHYGTSLLTDRDRKVALRDAHALIEAARSRTR